jgi:hypothetical protein
MLVFLGGTCGNNNWREGFIQRMVRRGCRRGWFFNPVVPNWNASARRREKTIKRKADYLLFYLGDPREPGNPLSYYSLLEAVTAEYDTDRSVVVFDIADLTSRHAIAAAKQALADLQARFPYAPIFIKLSDAENWLAARLLR